MSNELYTIDKTPSTDLEKFQALRIDALEKELQRHKEFLLKMQQEFEQHRANNIEVVEEEIV